MIGRRRAPTFPPVPPRGAPASGARRRPAVRAGGGRSPGGRSRHSGRGPGWGQRRHARCLPPRGKGREAKRRPRGERVTGAAAGSSRSAAPLPCRRAAHPAWRRDAPGVLLLPHRCHLVRAAAEAGARTLSGTQALEAARRRTGAANRFSAASPSFLPSRSRGFPRRFAPRRTLHAGGTPAAHPSSSSPTPQLSPSGRRFSTISRPRSVLSWVAPARAPGMPVPHHPWDSLGPSRPNSPGCPGRLPEEPSPPRGAAAALPVFLFLFAAPRSGGGAPGPARGGVGGAPGRPPANRRQRCVERRPMSSGRPRVIGGRAAAWPECQHGVSPPAAESGRPPPPPLPCPSLPSTASVWERRGRRALPAA